MAETSFIARTESAERGVARVVRGMPASDGAGVRLTRVIGQPALSELDPFLLLDEFRSDNPGDYIAGFPEHPHRGFETVTYLIAGRMRHEDNKGHKGLLTAGSVQWMTAGRGIVHSEMPEQEHGLLQGFQLWVNLPRRSKMTEPRYQEYEPAAIPEVRLPNGVRARVIAGRFAEQQGPIDAAATEPLYLDLTLPAGAETEVAIPESHAAFTYVFDGVARLAASDTRVPKGTLAVLGEGRSVRLRADEDGARLLVIAGKPLNEPVARYGPFVMSTEAEIHQAVRDFQAGRL
ncbi:MAG TPA: pirin family protein [Stellaceae bacterium]|nr:pirin family protein [Stellaceae bacterium]